MKNKKHLIITIIIFILIEAGTIFGFLNVDEIKNKIDEIRLKTNLSSTLIPEGYLKDEEALEKQTVEEEGFLEQDEIEYNGSEELPKVKLGNYSGLTYYSQIDTRWKNIPYTSTGNSTQTIGSSACGPTCAAMIVSSIKGNITPVEMSKLYVEYGFRSANNGTYWSAFKWTADVFDIEYLETYKLDEACELLKNNYMLIASCGNGLFTSGGHFIVIYAMEEDTLKIYDPYLYSGKFNINSRRGKVTLDGTTIKCSKENFRKYANYGKFFAFKNDRKIVTENKTVAEISNYYRYVKVNTSLNVRNGPGTNYNYVRSLYNGEKVTIYEENGNWSKIGENEWVCSDYLENEKSTNENTVINNTKGEYKKLANNTTLYSNSNLTGITYSYLKNTKIKIIENISENVDYIYVPATKRYAYVKTSAYLKNNEINLTNKYKTFKSNTIIYSNSNLTGTKYYYLPNTYVKILADLGNINKIYVTATGRVGYVEESVFK